MGAAPMQGKGGGQPMNNMGGLLGGWGPKKLAGIYGQDPGMEGKPPLPGGFPQAPGSAPGPGQPGYGLDWDRTAPQFGQPQPGGFPQAPQGSQGFPTPQWAQPGVSPFTSQPQQQPNDVPSFDQHTLLAQRIQAQQQAQQAQQQRAQQQQAQMRYAMQPQRRPMYYGGGRGR